MDSLDAQINISTEDDLFKFFNEAIEYRDAHKQESRKIAIFVFDNTHPAITNIPLNDDLERIRFEFGALEAPGSPEADIDRDKYDDKLWRRLSDMISETNKKRQF